jgi:hypothetical protein
VIEPEKAEELKVWAESMFGGEPEDLEGKDETYAPTEQEEEEDQEEEDRGPDVLPAHTEQEDVMTESRNDLDFRRRSRRQQGLGAGKSFTLEELRLIGAGQ